MTADARRLSDRRFSVAAWAIALLAGLLAVAGARPAEAGAPRPAYFVMDAETGRMLDRSRSRVRQSPASLTKMMTLYLVFEALRDRRLTLDQVLTTSRHAASMPPSELGLAPGDRVTVRDALRAAAVRSANDAAVVLAEAVAGTESAFARRMTQKARELGMRRTVFKNASGLTARGHVSTAEDMGFLARALIRDFPRHYPVFANESVRVRGRTYLATNKLLGREPGVDGVKTGYTRAAGYCLAGSAERGGRRVIVAYMGAPSRKTRDRRVAALLDKGFELLPPRRNSVWGETAKAPRPVPRRTTRAQLSAATAVAALDDAPARNDDLSTEQVSADAAAAATNAVIRPAATTDGDPDPTRWAIQVGAYSSEISAKARLDAILKLDAPGLRRAAPTPIVTEFDGDAGRQFFRARLTGLAEEDARRACRFLKSNRTDCALVPPRGWSRQPT